MEEHASSMQDFDLWAVALACADLGRRHQLGAGRVGHGSLSPEILGPFLIITILALAWSFVICLGTRILELPCPWLLTMKVQTGWRALQRPQAFWSSRPRLGPQGGSCLNVFFMKFL